MCIGRPREIPPHIKDRGHSTTDAQMTETVNRAVLSLIESAGGNVFVEHNAGSFDTNAYDDHIERLLHAFNSIQDKMVSYMAQLKRKRNASTDIFRLPTEVLTEVAVNFVHDPEADRNAPSRLHLRTGTLTLISWRWHQLVEQSPQIWSHICLTSPIAFTRAALAKSKAAKMTIIQPESHVLNNFRPEYDAFMTLVLPELHRCLSVDMTWPSYKDELLKTLQTPSPCLETLRIITWPRRHQEPPIQLLGGDAPRLRDLTMQGLPISLESTVIRGLRTLDLAFPIDTAVSTLEVFEVLRSCPDLEGLHLACGRPKPSGYSVILTPLLKLLHLSLRNVHPEMLRSLMDSIVAPECSSLQLKCCFSHDTITLDLPQPQLFLDHFPAMSRIVQTSQKANVTDASPTSIIYAIGGIGEPKVFEVDFLDCILDSTLDWLAEMNPRSRETSINVFYEDTDIGDEAVLNLLDQSFNVARIAALQPDEAGSTRFITYLGTPKLVGGELRWPFMSLAEIIIDYCRLQPSPLLAMITSRYGEAVEGQAPESVRLPRRLTKLRVGVERYVIVAFRTRIEDIVGPGVVRWEE